MFTKILHQVIKVIITFGPIVSIVGFIIYISIYIYIQVTNHIPTQIKEVKTELKEVKTELKENINKLETKIDNNQKEINQRFDKLYQILLDKK